MIKIVVDSCSSMSLDEANKKGISVVPMMFTINNNVTNPLDTKMTTQEFYDLLENHDTEVKTSCVSPQEYYDAFLNIIKNGDDVLYISLSKGLSGSFNSAHSAKDMLLDDYPNSKIEIINSLSGSIGIKLLIDEAINLVKEKNIEDVRDILNDYAKNITSTFTIGSLYHLYKGGRLSRTSLVTGNILRIKPIITASPEGKLEKQGVALGKNKAISSMISKLDSTIDLNHKTIYIGYTNNFEECEKTKNKLKEKYPDIEIKLEPIDMTMGCHCGPQTIAIFYFHK